MEVLIYISLNVHCTKIRLRQIALEEEKLIKSKSLLGNVSRTQEIFELQLPSPQKNF